MVTKMLVGLAVFSVAFIAGQAQSRVAQSAG